MKKETKKAETPKKEKKSKASRKKVDQVAELKIELAEAKDKYLRLYSEFDNYRKRTAKEKMEMVSTANENLMTDILPVVDDFERANSAITDNVELSSIQEGAQLVLTKFKKVLEKKNLKVMEIEPGDDFNPDFHEAISQFPSPDKKMKGKVIDVIEKGYYLGEKVVRFAKVVIGA